MREKRCLYCYQPLPSGDADFHEKCSLALFGTSAPPELDYSNEQMQELAEQMVLRSVAVTGVQPKLSLTIEPKPGDNKHSRFTILGLWGNYILKPPTAKFPHLPENEDLTMHLAKLFAIPVAMHSLIRLKSGELAYITKRFDRVNNEKLPLEDMCQLTETLTNDKYHSSMEKIGKCISNYSSQPGLDNITFFELTLFSYITGNADMHLKNFSLLTDTDNRIILAPAYDLLSTKIAIPEDREETALTINGRKNKLTKSDFDSLAKNLKLPEKSMQNSYSKFEKKLSEAYKWIDISFLPLTMKEQYKSILAEKASRIKLSK